MNEENQKLTLGAVQKEDLKFQPEPPQDELTAYFRDTDLGTILDDMTANGTEPDAALRILQRRGYDPEEVKGFMTSRYEEQRRQFLKQQEEERKRQEEEQRRIEGMSALSEEAVPEEKVRKLDIATEDEFGQPVSIARPEIAAVYQDAGILGDPYSPTSLPKDLVDAMDRGEDPTLRYQSYKNDRDMYDVYAQHNLATELNKAIKNKDVDSYNEIADELSDFGVFIQRVDNLDEDDYTDIQMSVFDTIQETKVKSVEDRNKINAQFGLPSGFNPESDVDFMYAMRESLERQEADFNSSDYKGYLDDVERRAQVMLERSDALDAIIFGKDTILDDFGGDAIESVIQGFTKKFMMPIVQAATLSIPAMYYEAKGDAGMYNAKMQALKKQNDIFARERQMRLMQRGLSEDEASLGVSELFEMSLDGQVEWSKFFNRMSYEVGEGFGQAIGYMVPIGRAARGLGAAKAAATRSAAAAAGKSVPRGVGLLTGEAASAARAIDASAKAAKALKAANRQYNAVFAALGINSAAGFYGDLYDRKDLSFAEKMIQSSIVGVAEATLGKLFSNVDKLFVGGARGMAKAAAMSDLKKMTEQKLKELSTRAGLKKGLGVTAKGLSEEFLEEFGVELVGQGVSIINDVAMGRQPQEINWHGLVDAGLAGMFGAGPTSVMAGVGTFQAHNSMLKQRRKLVNDLGEINDAIDRETDSELKANLIKLRDFKTLQIREIDGESRKAFSKMTEGQRRRLLKIHRDMAYTEAKLKDPSITKEQREELKKRYANLLRAKMDIENSESEVEPDMTASDPSVTVKDAAGNDVESESQPLNRLERTNAKLTSEASETAPRGQEQEAEQLSMFDETQEEEAERVREKPTPKKPIADQTDDSEFDEFDAQGLIDIADPEQVGEGGKFTLEQALQKNALAKSLGEKLTKDGFKVRRFKTRAAFNRAQNAAETDDSGGGFVDFDSKTINLAPDATAREIQEEFAHAAFRDILGEYAPQRRELFAYLEEIRRENKGIDAAFKVIEESYPDAPPAEFEEEVIVEVLLGYAEGSIDLKRKQKSNIIGLINSLFASFFNTQNLDQNQIKNDKEFEAFAKTFKRAVRGEGKVDVKAPDVTMSEQDTAKRDTESEQEYRERLERMATEALGDTEGTTVSEEDALSQETEDLTRVRFSKKRKQEFNYLKDTVVYYTEDGYAEIGDTMQQFERTADKKMRFNDYFHFRNWYNHMTSNGRRPARIANMYFIKDGKKYTVKPPKPRTDKDGNVLYMNGAENKKFTNARRAWQKQFSKAREINEAREATYEFGRKADNALKRAGIDSAGGMVFFPGFDYAEFSSIEDRSEQFSYMAQARREMFQKTPQEIRETLEVMEANFEALRQSGMTVDEIQAADKSKLFNMSGLTPHHMAKAGDATKQGNIRKSKKRKASRVVDTPKTLRSKVEQRGGTMGAISDIAGALGINFGYDRSGGRIGTGLINQLTQRTRNGEIVASSHRDQRMAELILNKFQQLAVEDALSPNPKGYVAFTFAVLDLQSMAGNPQIFADVARRALGGGKVTEQNFEAVAAIINEMLGEGGSGKRKNLRDLSRAPRISRQGGLISRYLASGKTEIEVRTIEEAQAVVDTLLDSTPENIKQNFENRNRFARRIIDKFLSDGESTNDYLLKNYSDRQFDKAEGGTVISYTKVPYSFADGFSAKNVSKDNAFKAIKGLRYAYLPNEGIKGEAFAYGLVVESKDANPMTFLEEQVGLADVYSEAKSSKGTEKFRDQLPDETEEEYEDYLKAEEAYLGARGVEGRVTDHRRRSRKRGFKMEEQSGFERWKNKWIKRLQDKYVDIFNIQESIERQTGKLSSDQDFKMAEELMYGKAAEDLAKLDAKVETITKMMKDAGIKVDVLSEYMYALHAKERNALISQRSNGAVVDGSGMTDAEADAILNAANKASLDPIVAEIRKIQQDTRDTMVKFGLETKETVDAFEAMFDNYIPLAGLAVDEATGSPYPTGGAGMNVFGPTTKRAEGRKSKAENVLAQVIAQNAGIHIKARTNEALSKLYNLVEDNPNPRVWRVLDKKDVTDAKDPRVVAVRINGEQKFIYFNDPSYAETLRGMNLPQSNAFIRALRAPAQWLRASFTTLNPEFVISNFSRDIQSAIFNATAEAEIEGGMLNSTKTVRRIFSLVPQTLKTLTKNAIQRGGDPAIEKYFAEFKEDGGKTGWAYAKPLDQIASELSGGAEGKTRTQEILGKAKNFGEFIEGINDAFENSIRLASYIAARENGVSREKAAQMAKNITVNFNKQGEWGPTLNAVYLFFNASIQGTARLGRSLLSLRPQKRPDGTNRKNYERITSAQWMAGGLSLFSSMLTMLGYAMSDEDEDGIPFWDKIPDYVKERNLIIMRPNGKDYFKIPMPYGFNVFANMGTAMTEAAYGGREADEAMMFLFNSFMASFSPVSFGQSKDLFTSVGKGAVPTVMKPFVDVMVNETYFGSPVTGENLPFGVQRPESELSFRSPDQVKDFFKWMNEATGGSEYKSGGLDFNPDKFWYMFEYYIGGAGQFVNRSLFKFPKQLQAKLFSDEDIEIQAGDVPLARLLYGQPSKYFDMEKFKENEKEFKALYKEAKESPKLDDLARYKGINPSTNSLFNKIKKQLEMLRKARYEANKIENYSERTARVQELRDKERSLIMKWNKFYEQARN